MKTDGIRDENRWQRKEINENEIKQNLAPRGTAFVIVACHGAPSTYPGTARESGRERGCCYVGGPHTKNQYRTAAGEQRWILHVRNWGQVPYLPCVRPPSFYLPKFDASLAHAYTLCRVSTCPPLSSKCKATSKRVWKERRLAPVRTYHGGMAIYYVTDIRLLFRPDP